MERGPVALRTQRRRHGGRRPAAQALLATALLTQALAGSAAADGALAGRWTGHWQWAGGSALAIAIDFVPAAEGWEARFAADALRAVDIPLREVSGSGAHVSWRLVGDATTAVFTGTLAGDSLAGTVVEGERSGTFALTRSAEVRSPSRAEELAFRSGELTLAGSLVLPADPPGRVPAVVFLHGSGAEGRWASAYLARRVAERGVAALIFDKRGVGGSQGDWRLAGLDEMVADGVAALAAVRAHPAIDPARVGVHGHSQGGTIAPAVAARGGAAFVVASAASGVPMDECEVYSLESAIGVDGLAPEEARQAKAFVRALVDTAYHGAPRAELERVWQAVRERPWAFPPPAREHHYWSQSRRIVGYDPLPPWREVAAPALLLFGERDGRVPPRASARAIAASYLAGPGASLTVKVYSGADHGYRLAVAEGEWPTNARGYPDEMLAWIERVTSDPADRTATAREPSP